MEEQEVVVAVAVVEPIAVKISTAAAMAEVSTVMVYEWIKQKKLPTIGVGSDQRILVDEYKKFLREGKGRGKIRRLRGRPRLDEKGPK